MRRPWSIVAVVLFSLAILFGGLFGDDLLALSGETRSALKLYTEMVSVAHRSYGTDVTYKDLVYASINGMLRTLDPHTNFLPAEAYDSMRERQQSSFYGLGILVGMRDDRLTVVTPVEGTPASRMGIRAGDVISHIEGEPTAGMGINEAVSKLKGPKGTTVRVTIQRRGLDEPLEMEIVRDEIPQNTISYAFMITPNTGYIMLTDFSRATAREMADTIAELKDQGMERLLLDLRSNGGGLLDQAIEVADQFLPKGARIVETHGRISSSHQVFDAEGDFDQLGLPVVVLVGGSTASAAEILAGAIQDHDLGLIVGTPTWGKGLVQTVYALNFRNGLALTTAKYYTPSGRLIQRDYSSWYDYATHGNANPDVDVDPSTIDQELQESYSTDLGRTVYGGGGITPDLIVEPTELDPFLQFLIARNAFFNYAVERNNRQPITDGSWAPTAEDLTGFGDWLDAEALTDDQEFETAIGDEAMREQIQRRLHAEVLGAAFGLQERFRVLATADEQIQAALESFDQAGELLASRLDLDESGSRPSTGSSGGNLR
jgi:carboxyl-terminal processing protease